VEEHLATNLDSDRWRRGVARNKEGAFAGDVGCGWIVNAINEFGIFCVSGKFSEIPAKVSWFRRSSLTLGEVVQRGAAVHKKPWWIVRCRAVFAVIGVYNFWLEGISSI
jgi:hypothetical protein